jgi:hypothetical protein
VISALLLALAFPAIVHATPEIDAVQTAVGELQSGKPTITGIPTFQNGICLGTASSCMTTVPTSGAGLASTQTFTGADTFVSSLTLTGPVQLATATYVVHGSSTAPPLGFCFDAIWARSTSPVADSTGTVVLWKFDGNNPGASFVFTSTNSEVSVTTYGGQGGVVIQGAAQGSTTCNPWEICQVCINGFFRSYCTSDLGTGNTPDTAGGGVRGSIAFRSTIGDSFSLGNGIAAHNCPGYSWWWVHGR